MKAVFGLMVILMCWACKQDTNEAANAAAEPMPAIDKLKKEYEIQPSITRARAYLSEVNAHFVKHYDEPQKVKPYLQQAADVAEAQNLPVQAVSFLMPLTKSADTDQSRKQYALRLANNLVSLDKKHAASIIYLELKKQYPNDKAVQDAQANVIEEALAHGDYIEYLLDQILVDPGQYGVNEKAALKYVDAAEAFALVNPTSPKTPEYLYKASEVARGLRTMPKAMALYDWILESYPKYEKYPLVLFIKGFILENEFKNYEAAKEVYVEFLEKYPKDDMAESVKYLLDNLGKEDNEIIEKLKTKQTG